MLRTRLLSDGLGVELMDIDLHADIPAQARLEASEAFEDSHVVIVRGQQDLKVEEQVRFAECFGRIRRPSKSFHPMADLEMYVSNTRSDAQDGQTSHEFVPHMDYVATSTLLPAICLYGQQVPRPGTGGETYFIDMGQAYEQLSPSTKAAVTNLTATHVGSVSRGALREHRITLDASYRSSGSTPETSDAHSWPVVLRHPRTQRPLLFVSPLQTYCIDGLSPQVSDELLAELFSVLENPDIRYRHEWRIGDILIWDNIALLHGRTAFPETESRTLRKLEVDVSV